jgi:ABC-2 type transport system permease protein
MTQTLTDTTLAVPDEALSPRDQRLERAARILQIGAAACGVVAALILLAALVAAFGASGLLAGARNVLLSRYTGADDTALAIVILLSLLNMSLLLVLMVGVLARELWALPGLWIFALANGAGMLLAGFMPGLVALAASVIASGVLSRDIRAFRLNPVMLKELRGRMRGMRAFVVMTVYLGLMSGFATLLYLLYTTGMRTSASAAAGEIGRVLFMGIVGIELLLIIFIAPAFTAGAITGERERQTYDLLRTTLLASPSFVIGKLESALGYILLLLLAAIPLQSIAFLFGGVSETEIILSFIILAVSAVALGTIGIYFSSVMQRTLTASVRAYTVTLVATFAVPLVLGIIISILSTALYGAGANSGNSPVLEAFLNYVQLLLTSMNPVSTALTTQELLVNRQVTGFWTQTLSNGSTIPMVSPWISFTILYLTASAVLIVLTIRSTRRVEM